MVRLALPEAPPGVPGEGERDRRYEATDRLTCQGTDGVSDIQRRHTPLAFLIRSSFVLHRRAVRVSRILRSGPVARRRARLAAL